MQADRVVRSLKLSAKRLSTTLPVQNALCKESLRVFSKNAFLAMFYGFRVWFGGAV